MRVKREGSRVGRDLALGGLGGLKGWGFGDREEGNRSWTCI